MSEWSDADAQHEWPKHAQASDIEAPLARTNASHVETPVRTAQLCSCPGSPEELHTPLAQSPLWSQKLSQHVQVLL